MAIELIETPVGRNVNVLIRGATKEEVEARVAQYFEEYHKLGYGTFVTQHAAEKEPTWGENFLPCWEARLTRYDSCD